MISFGSKKRGKRSLKIVGFFIRERKEERLQKVEREESLSLLSPAAIAFFHMSFLLLFLSSHPPLTSLLLSSFPFHLWAFQRRRRLRCVARSPKGGMGPPPMSPPLPELDCVHIGWRKACRDRGQSFVEEEGGCHSLLASPRGSQLALSAKHMRLRKRRWSPTGGRK